MKHVLGVETATDRCSVAIDRDGDPICCMTIGRPRMHAERLVSMAGDALRSVGLSPDDLDAVAVSAGPGSYTGLRIGVSVCKGLVMATGCRFIPVSSLAALAVAGAYAEGTRVLSVLSSRRTEVYMALSHIGPDGIPERTSEALAGPPADVLHRLDPPKDEPLIVMGEGSRLVSRILRASDLSFIEDPRTRPLASAVVRLARHTVLSGSPVDVDSFEPYYLRDFVARPAAGSVFDRLPF